MTPNDLYISRTAPLTSKRCILYIYSTNTGTEYFKHALYSPFFPLQNAVCFIMPTCLVPVLFTFYIQGVLKLKKNNSGAKGLITLPTSNREESLSETRRIQDATRNVISYIPLNFILLSTSRSSKRSLSSRCYTHNRIHFSPFPAGLP